MSSIPIPVKEALTVLAGACDDLSRVIRELPEAAVQEVAEPGVAEPGVAPVAAPVVPAEAPEAGEPVVPAEAPEAGVPAEVEEAAQGPAQEAAQGPAQEAAQGPAEEVEGEQAAPPAAVEGPAQGAVPGAAQPDFKETKSLIKFKTWGGKIETNYFQIMQKITKFFRTIDNKIETADEEDKDMLRARRTKYQEVKNLLESATTPEEVQKIINEKQVEFDSGNITGGGTRKPRMHRRKKTQRKRSKTIKKKPKSGNRK